MRDTASHDTLRTPQSPSQVPNWRPPKAPLPPHRLAKLANALGVSTPIPANHPGPFLGRSYSESASSLDPYRRSPTPSTVASTSYTSTVPVTSKFLLHVLPPLTFPYDPDSIDDNDLIPPPSTASGYHTQFRRGILVPVHSSFHSQLSAIAKEYALPSTAGLILYLVGSPSTTRPSGLSPDEIMEEPGPRLSEEIWKHLWTRVLQAEQHDDRPSSRNASRGLVALRTGLASRSTPHLHDTISPPLRPLMSTPTPENPPPPPNGTSPSTPSSVSDIRSNSKSVVDSSADEPDTPDTSAPSNAFPSFDLPGLRSPSLIPILAKVEFDIDRRKAVWYDPWLRNRKANHAKRAESRAGGGKASASEEGTAGHERHPPIRLIIGTQQAASPISLMPSPSEGYGIQREEPLESESEEQGVDYQQLEDLNEQEAGDSDLNEEADLEDGDETFHTGAVNGTDPLAEVFGTDADTWADIHNFSGDKRPPNPNVVNLALTAADLSTLPDDSLEEHDSVMRPEEEEVRELLEQMSRPNSHSTVQMEVLSSPPSKRSSASTHTAKKHVPPPLVLIPKGGHADLVVPAEPTPMPSSADSTHLAYLNGSESSPEKPTMQRNAEAEAPENEFDDRYSRVRSPAESEKRAGTIYDELDLGLDPNDDFDENDPNDRRRSQLLLKAQLDEIERTMAQFSPQLLNPELERDNFTSASFSPKSPSSILISPKPGLLNHDVYPPSPSPSAEPLIAPEHSRASNRSDFVRGPPRTSSTGAITPVWPAVPFSSIRDSQQGTGKSSRTDGPPSPPRLALNGVTTSAPKSFVPHQSSSNALSAETEKRKRELEDEYPALSNARSSASGSPVGSPVIPLSPDPFGRYPSVSDSTVRLSNSSLHQWDTVTLGRGSISLEPVPEGDDPVQRAFHERSRSATTSRFSADSITIAGEENVAVKPSMKSTLMNVRSIKKLWRKSNSKSSVSKMPTIPSGRSSPQMPPVRPERPSQETMDLPDVDHPLPAPPPNFKAYSPQPSSPISLPSPRVSQDQYRPSRTSQDQYNPSRTSYDRMNVPNAHVPQNPNLPQTKQGLQVPHTPTQGGYSVPTHQPNHKGLMVPQQNQGLGLLGYTGRSPSGPPIVAAQMLPGRGGSSLDKFHFDQESPYPVHLTNSPRYSPRPISPPALPPAQAQNAAPPVPAPAPAPAQAQQAQTLPPPLLPEKEKPTGRKSILKAFQKSPKTPPLPSPTDLQSSPDGQSSTGRPRKPSLHSTKSSTTSVNDMPPSPMVQEQFLQGSLTRNGTIPTGAAPSSGAGGHQESGLTGASTDSTTNSQAGHLGRSTSQASRSRASSRSSQDTTPSFDASQFEIVSPKTLTLTYPYHGLDHQ